MNECMYVNWIMAMRHKSEGKITAICIEVWRLYFESRDGMLRLMADKPRQNENRAGLRKEEEGKYYSTSSNWENILV